MGDGDKIVKAPPLFQPDTSDQAEGIVQPEESADSDMAVGEDEVNTDTVSDPQAEVIANYNRRRMRPGKPKARSHQKMRRSKKV